LFDGGGAVDQLIYLRLHFIEVGCLRGGWRGWRARHSRRF
jgi:hypothetical protein